MTLPGCEARHTSQHPWNQGFHKVRRYLDFQVKWNAVGSGTYTPNTLSCQNVVGQDDFAVLGVEHAVLGHYGPAFG